MRCGLRLLSRSIAVVLVSVITTAPAGASPSGPGPVRDLEARPGARGQVVVTWSPPADDGGSPVVGYQVVTVGRYAGSAPTTVADTTVVVEARPGAPFSVVIGAIDAAGRLGAQVGVEATAPLSSGYRLIGASATTALFGEAEALTLPPLGPGVTTAAATATWDGWDVYVLGSDGAVRSAFATTPLTVDGLVLLPGEQWIALWTHPARRDGYWAATDQGRVVESRSWQQLAGTTA